MLRADLIMAVSRELSFSCEAEEAGSTGGGMGVQGWRVGIVVISQLAWK